MNMPVYGIGHVCWCVFGWQLSYKSYEICEIMLRTKVLKTQAHARGAAVPRSPQV